MHPTIFTPQLHRCVALPPPQGEGTCSHSWTAPCRMWLTCACWWRRQKSRRCAAPSSRRGAASAPSSASFSQSWWEEGGGGESDGRGGEWAIMWIWSPFTTAQFICFGSKDVDSYITEKRKQGCMLPSSACFFKQADDGLRRGGRQKLFKSHPL